MNRVSRREFLKQGSSAVALVAGSAGLRVARPQAAGAQEPHREFPTEPRARLAVASYPFREFMDTQFNRRRNPQKPGMNLPAFAQTVVERFNVRGIEPLSSHFSSRQPADLEALHSAFTKAGVHVVNIPVDMRPSFFDPDPVTRQTAVDTGKQWVDVAAALDSPGIRVHIARAHGAAPDFVVAAQSLSQLADYGGQHNVAINLENDDLVSEDAFFIVRVIDHAQHPFLRALPDFGNTVLAGDPAYNQDALALMFRHAFNISHMKDSEAGDGGKIYNADVPGTFQIAKASGYRGYFSMEMDRPGDPYEGTAKLIEASLKSLKTDD